MKRGDSVDVTIGGRVVKGTVLYERDGSVRVELADGRKVTRPRARVKTERAATVPTSLGVGPLVDLSKYPTPHLAMPAKRSVPKPPKRLRDAAYLRHVRALACCVSRDGASGPCSGPIVAHHHGPRGLGEKTDDYRTVPLCDGHHREFHDRGTIGEWTRDALDRSFVYVMSNTLSFWMWASDRHAARARMLDALVEHLREST